MKKTFLVISIILVILSASACSGTSSANNSSAGDASSAQAEVQSPATSIPAADTSQQASDISGLNTTYENAVSVEMQLLLGTLQLEGGDLAITTEQAAALLPLWSELNTISQNMMQAGGGFPGQGGAPGQQGAAPDQNGTPAPGQGDLTPQAPEANTEIQTQIDAVVEQILAVMTPEQIAAIAAMQITQESAMSMMEELGITTVGPQGGGGQMQQGTPPADMQGGGMMGTPQGGQPGGGPGGQQPGGQQPGGQMPTMEAGGQGFGGGGMMLSPQLIDALLQLLGTRSGNPLPTSTPMSAP